MYPTLDYPTNNFKTLRGSAKKAMSRAMRTNLSNRQQQYLNDDAINPTQTLTTYGQAIDDLPPLNRATISIWRPSDYQYHDSVKLFQKSLESSGREENKYNTQYGNFIATDKENDWIVDPRTYAGALRTMSKDGNSALVTGQKMAMNAFPNQESIFGDLGTNTLIPLESVL